MLYLDIQGKAPRRRCRDVVEWFKAKYMPKHHLYIEVLHRGLKREHAVGFCTVTDCDYRPREYEDQPWEHEAQKMEQILFNEYMGIEECVFFPNRLTDS